MSPANLWRLRRLAGTWQANNGIDVRRQDKLREGEARTCSTDFLEQAFRTDGYRCDITSTKTAVIVNDREKGKKPA